MINCRPMNIGYVRVSHINQVKYGVSLQNQKEEIKRLADFLNLHLNEIYSDEGISAYKKQRPGFLEVMSLCRRGLVENLFIYQFSRFGRNFKSTIEAVEELNEKKIKIRSVKENLDLTSPIGLTIFRVLASFNDYDSLDKGVKIKDTLQYNKENRILYGSLPYGFYANQEIDKTGRLVKRLIKNDDEQETIQKIIELRNLGFTYQEISYQLEDLNKKNRAGRIFNIKTIRNIFIHNTNEEIRENYYV